MTDIYLPPGSLPDPPSPPAATDQQEPPLPDPEDPPATTYKGRYRHSIDDREEDEYRGRRFRTTVGESRDSIDGVADDFLRGHVAFDLERTTHGDASDDYLAKVYALDLALGDQGRAGAFSLDVGYGIRGGVRAMGHQQLFAQIEVRANAVHGGTHQGNVWDLSWSGGIGGRAELGAAFKFLPDDTKTLQISVYTEQATNLSETGISIGYAQ